MPGRLILNLNNKLKKSTYELCEWYGCALTCVPFPACTEQSYPCNGSKHQYEKKCWMTMWEVSSSFDGTYINAHICIQITLTICSVHAVY